VSASEGGRRAAATSTGLILALLDEAYSRKAWHGPNLRGALRGVSAREAAWRPSAARHNIWELTVHASYWKYAVRRILTGERRGSFSEKGSNWFRRPTSATPGAWRRDVARLDAEHRRLRDVVAGLPATGLSRRLPGSKYATARLLYGVASHDLYHTGQIQLLKVLQRRKRRRA